MKLFDEEINPGGAGVSSHFPLDGVGGGGGGGGGGGVYPPA